MDYLDLLSLSQSGIVLSSKVSPLTHQYLLASVFCKLHFNSFSLLEQPSVDVAGYLPAIFQQICSFVSKAVDQDGPSKALLHQFLSLASDFCRNAECLLLKILAWSSLQI